MIRLPNATVYHGSNLDVLPTLPDNSVDSIVTDPPYELGFMGKSWDNSGIAYSVELWTECMRVLKPGGHLLAFGGSRTWHRLAVAIEDAGFEMRDSIAWLYGSGFPKSMDVAKAIDKQSGYDGEVIGTETVDVGMQGGSMHAGRETKLAEREIKELSPEAQKWQGWGTALKPAFEPVVVARKPLIGTVAANVLAYGTGGLNIDASRIGTEQTITNHTKRPTAPSVVGNGAKATGEQTLNPAGRWPANIILDPYTAELLDEQSGISKSQGGRIGKKDASNVDFGLSGKYEKGDPGFGDVGGASRYFKIIEKEENNEQIDAGDSRGNQTSEFAVENTRNSGLSRGFGMGIAEDANTSGRGTFIYQAKASKKDRNEGLEELPVASAAEMVDREEGSAGMNSPRAGAPRTSGSANIHPTVKPTALMEYLIKLVTPKGGTVLDPFTGSGSTGKAALLNGYQFIGIELTDEYLPIIEGRLKWANEQASKKEEEKSEVLF